MQELLSNRKVFLEAYDEHLCDHTVNVWEAKKKTIVRAPVMNHLIINGDSFQQNL